MKARRTSRLPPTSPRQPGLDGLLERLAVSLLFPRIYEKELVRLAEYVRGLRTGPGANLTSSEH